MTVEIIVSILALVALIAFFKLLLKRSLDKITRQYQLLAEKYDLELTTQEPKLFGLIRPEPSVFGVHAGREISISVPGAGLQNTRQTESVLKLGLSRQPWEARMVPAGKMASLYMRDAKHLSSCSESDQTLSETIALKCNNPSTCRRIVTGDFRQWLVEDFKRSQGSIYIGEASIAYARFGSIANDKTRQDFETALHNLSAVADTIENEKE